MTGAEREVTRLKKAGELHAADLPGAKDVFTTSRAASQERETIALLKAGRGRGFPAMRARAVDKALRNGPLTRGQRGAVKLVLSEKDRAVGVQGNAGAYRTSPDLWSRIHSLNARTSGLRLEAGVVTSR